MNKILSSCARSLAPLGLMLMFSPTWAGEATSAPSKAAAAIDVRYAKERQVCLDGRSNQDRATCLKEAGAARDEARRRQLDTGDSAAQRAANALQRCNEVPAAERVDCERLARGEGEVSGSVGGGGVIKELVTKLPAPPPEPAKAP